MAIEKVIKIDVDQVKAIGGLEKLEQSFNDVEKSSKSLKQQLRESVQEAQSLADKFGANSKQATEAYKRTAELKEKIEDANDAIQSFKGEGAFLATNKAIGAVTSGLSAYQGALGLAGVESENLQKQLLKVQSAMAVSQGLAGLEDAGRSFKQLKAVAIDAFKGIKTAIGSTGIGLLVVALGTIYAYWDDIKEAVSGVSEEQRKLNADSKKNLEQENEKLKTLGSQDNILKLQGKSEKEILAIKVRQTDEAIQATEINIKNQEQTNKLAVDGAKRNYEMLKSYIDFISTPIRFLYKTGAEAINGIIDLLNKIPGVNIKGKLDEALGDKASDYITKLGFDPDKVKEEGDKTVKESADALTKLKNDRAGYLLSIKDINKREVDDAKKKAEELAKIESDRQQKLLDELDAMNDFDQRVIDNEAKKNAELKKLDDEAFAELEKDFDRKLELDRKAKEDALALEKKLHEEKTAIRNAEIEVAQGVFTILAGLGEKNKALQKTALIAQSALSIASIIVNTNVGSSKEVSTKGIFGLSSSAILYAKMGVSIASVLAATAKGLSALGGGSAPSVSSGGSSGSSESTPPSFNIVGQNSNNQLAQSISQQQQQPIQAYVVSGNITSAQSLDRNKIETATFN